LRLYINPLASRISTDRLPSQYRSLPTVCGLAASWNHARVPPRPRHRHAVLPRVCGGAVAALADERMARPPRAARKLPAPVLVGDDAAPGDRTGTR
jgi:hypothetical protein